MMGSKKKTSSLDKGSEEYKARRERNNNAVKRSRDKSKAKAVESQVRVEQLQSDNDLLRTTVDSMTQELKYLKEMLISQAVDFLSPQMEQELEELLREDAPTDVAKISNILAEMKRLQSLHQEGASSSMAYGAVPVQPSSSAIYQTNPAQVAQDLYQIGVVYDQSLGGGHHGNLNY